MRITLLLIILMIMFIFSFTISISLYIRNMHKLKDDDKRVFEWLIAFLISGLLFSLFGYIIFSSTIRPIEYIISHMDKKQTRIIEENDKVVDIFITVNGEEYHFDLREVFNS